MAHPAGISHEFESEVAEGGDASLVRTSNWNEAHHIELPVQMGADLTFDVGQIVSASGTINFLDTDIICEGCQVLGDLQHCGDNIGFFGTGPETQQAIDDLGAVVATVAAAPAGAGHVDLAALSAVLTDFKTSVNAALTLGQTTINEILAALRLYGLLSTP